MRQFALDAGYTDSFVETKRDAATGALLQATVGPNARVEVIVTERPEMTCQGARSESPRRHILDRSHALAAVGLVADGEEVAPGACGTREPGECWRASTPVLGPFNSPQARQAASSRTGGLRIVLSKELEASGNASVDSKSGEASDAGRMPFEDPQGLSGLRVPQANRVVPRARGAGNSSVDFERSEAGDMASMPFEDAQGPSGARVPQADRVVTRARGEGEATVDFERGEAGDGISVPYEGAQGLSGLRLRRFHSRIVLS